MEMIQPRPNGGGVRDMIAHNIIFHHPLRTMASFGKILSTASSRPNYVSTDTSMLTDAKSPQTHTHTHAPHTQNHSNARNLRHSNSHSHSNICPGNQVVQALSPQKVSPRSMSPDGSTLNVRMFSRE